MPNNRCWSHDDQRQKPSEMKIKSLIDKTVYEAFSTVRGREGPGKRTDRDRSFRKSAQSARTTAEGC